MSGKQVNLLYIIDRDHQRSVVEIDHSSNFKGILDDVKPSATYELQHRKWRNTYPGKRRRKLLFKIEKKKSGKLKTCQK